MLSKGKRYNDALGHVVEVQTQIENLRLQEELLQLARQLDSVSSRSTFRPVTDSEWESMSPAEKLERLNERFITIRAEVLFYRLGIEERGKSQRRLSEWLDSPAVKVVNLAGALATLAVLAYQGGWEGLRILGLGGGPGEDETERITYVIDE